MKLNLKVWNCPLLVIAVIGCLVSGCKRDAVIPSKELIVLIEKNITTITETTAFAGGSIFTDANVTAGGVVWSKTAKPTIISNIGKTDEGSGEGDFNSTLTSQQAGTGFYIRAYATNSAGTTYGDEASFTTVQKLLSAPSQTSAAGYTKLTFQDEFTSINTIDTAATKAAGFKWYTDGAFGGENALRSAYNVAGGVLSVTNSGSFNGNWVLASVSPQANVGKSFKYAYFEARIKFNPTLGILSAGFPAWWSFSRNHTVTGDPVRWGRLIFLKHTRLDMQIIVEVLLVLLMIGRIILLPIIKTVIIGCLIQGLIITNGILTVAFGSQELLLGTLME